MQNSRISAVSSSPHRKCSPTHFFQQCLLQKVFCSSRTTICPLHRRQNPKAPPKVTTGRDPQMEYVLKQGYNKGFQQTKLRKGMYPEKDSFNKKGPSLLYPNADKNIGRLKILPLQIYIRKIPNLSHQNSHLGSAASPTDHTVANSCAKLAPMPLKLLDHPLGMT